MPIFEHHVVGGQGGIDGSHQLNAKFVFLQQMPKSQDGALVWQAHVPG